MFSSLLSKITLLLVVSLSVLTGCSLSDHFAEQAECLKPQGPYPRSCGVNYNGPTGEQVLSTAITGGNPDIRYLTVMQNFYPDMPISVEKLLAVAKAAEQGDEESIMALGRIYYEIGYHYTNCSVVQTGQNWLRRGSDMQLAHPKVMLSQHYFSGICMPINVDKALQLAREASAIDDHPIIIEWLDYASNPDNQKQAAHEREQQLKAHQGTH